MTLDPWTSLGLSGAPNTPPVVSSISVTASADGDAGSPIVVTLQGIKVGIDGETITMTPLAVTSTTSGITWANTSTSTDPVLKKYFAIP